MREKESIEVVSRDVLLPNRYRTVFHEAAVAIRGKGSRGITIEKGSLRRPRGDYDPITPAGTLGFTIQGAEKDIAKLWGEFADKLHLKTEAKRGPQPFIDTDTGSSIPRVFRGRRSSR
jgi:hypothetical protein